MCLRVSYKKDMKNNFLHPLSRRRKVTATDPELDPDPLVRVMDPRIWIRTKMLRIPNTGYEHIICNAVTVKRERGCWLCQIRIRIHDFRIRVEQVLKSNPGIQHWWIFMPLDLSWTTTAPAWPRVRWTPASGLATSRPRLVESVSRSKHQ